METKQLEVFFNDLESFLNSNRELRKRIDRELATSFSVFDYITPDERMLSRIIADLLKPTGNHGQGTLFLELFLQRIDSPLLTNWRSSLEQASVQTEQKTNSSASRRSIDILITIKLPDGELAIGIENKPFAKESENQLSKYQLDLDIRFKGRSILIFLSKQTSPNSMEEDEWSRLAKSGRATDWGFNDGFYNWLTDCRKHCESEKIRNFIRDFQNYIDQNVQQISTERSR